LNFFKNFFKPKASSTIVNLSDKSTAVWPDRNYDNFAKETYLKNVISFRCVDMISKSVAMVKWKLMEKQKDGYKIEIVNHPLIDLMYRPNPTQGWTIFCKGLISYLTMAGNSYIRRIAPITGIRKGIPIQMDLLRPDRVKVLIATNGDVVGYEYSYTSTIGSGSYTKQYMIDPKTGKSDVLQMKLFNPVDDYYGAAITESVAREVDTQNASTEWNKKLLDNEARPGMVITYNKNLSDDQFYRLENQINAKYSGSRNAGKNLILEGAEGAKVDLYGFSPSEMDFIQGNQELCRRIASGYGVPSQLIGIAGDNTYANYEQAREAFWDETVIFYLDFLKTELNNWFFEKGSNIELCYTLDGIPAYASRQNMLWDRAKTSDFITINEKREMVGYEKIEGGDTLFVPMSAIPLGESTSSEESTETEEAEGEMEAETEEEAKSKLRARGYTEEQVNAMMGSNW
jgi:HK97 family phage portal protein